MKTMPGRTVSENWCFDGKIVSSSSFNFPTLFSRNSQGNFFGHLLPAIFMFGFSFCLLMVALVRARSLPPGRSYAEMYIPKNQSIGLTAVWLCHYSGYRRWYDSRNSRRDCGHEQSLFPTGPSNPLFWVLLGDCL